MQNDLSANLVQSSMRVAAYWTELDATVRRIEAATMLSNGAEADRLREKAHSLLDNFLDEKQSIITLVGQQQHGT